MKLFGAFIGINDYQDEEIVNLYFAKNDATKVYDLFSNSFSPEEADLTLLTDKAARKTEILKLLGEYLPANAQEDDIVVIYFAGHGTPELDGGVDNLSRYLVAHDTVFRNIFSTGIDLEHDILKIYKRIKSKLIITFIDSCFSGKAGGRTFEGPHYGKRRREYRTSLSLQDLNLGEGRIIITASDDFEKALENRRLEHGVFTHYFMEGITLPDFKDTIGIGRLYEYIFEHVYTYSNGQQRPVLNGRYLNAQLPILRKHP